MNKKQVVYGLLSALMCIFTIKADIPPAAIEVPQSECPCSPPNGDVDPCCTASVTPRKCFRLDSDISVTFAGNMKIVSIQGTCNNCAEGCPHDPPAPLNCGEIASVSAVQSASVTISSNIQAGIPGIEFGFSNALGATVGMSETVTVNCSRVTPPCEVYTDRASLEVTTDRTAEMTHEWWLTGSWSSIAPGCDCSISGNVWIQYCGADTSTGTANLAGNGLCENVEHHKCCDLGN